MPDLPPPDGTRPLTEHVPWGGPTRPERLLYANGTPLDVRCQGDESDETWHATAAGAVLSADGLPGELQVVRWESGRCATVHPALTCPQGTDPYAGLSSRDRARWEAFDYFEHWDGTTAYLPCHLLDTGDVVHLPNPHLSRRVEACDVVSTADVRGGESRQVTMRRRSDGSTVQAAWPSSRRIAVAIPEHHPTLGAVNEAVGQTRPAPATPVADSTQTGAPPTPPPADAAADEKPGDDTPATSEPEPPGRLTVADVAIALSRLPGWELARLVRATKDPHALSALSIGGRRSNRREGEPDAGANEEIDHDRKGIRIRIGTPDGERTGFLSWRKVLAWIEPGITPGRDHLLQKAADVRSRYNVLEDGFVATGQRELYRAALRELDHILATAADAVITAAAAANEIAPASQSRRGRKPRQTSGAQGQLLPTGEPHDDDRTAMLARVVRFESVLPPTRLPPTRAGRTWARVMELQPGDVIRGAGSMFHPFILTEPPHDHGDHITLTGQEPRRTGPDQARTVTYYRKDHADPRVELVPPPASLQGIVRPGHTVPSARPRQLIRPGGQAAGTTDGDFGTPALQHPETAPAEAPPERAAPTPAATRSAPANTSPPTPAPREPTKTAVQGGTGSVNAPETTPVHVEPSSAPGGDRPNRADHPAATTAANTDTSRLARPAASHDTSGHGHPMAGRGGSDRAEEHTMPDEPAHVADAELDQSYAGLVAALSARQPIQGGPATTADRGTGDADSFSDIWVTFNDLKRALGLPTDGARPKPEFRSPGGGRPYDDPVLRPLDDAIAEAQSAAGWLQDTPEWRRIHAVRDAARALLTTVRDAAADYWTEIRRDMRVRGFVHTVAARASRAVADIAERLTRRLERAGLRDTPAWNVMSRLHRAAADHARRLIARPPPGEHLRDAQRIVGRIHPLPSNQQTATQVPGNPAASRHGIRPTRAAAAAKVAFPGPVTGSIDTKPAPPATRGPAPAPSRTSSTSRPGH